MHQLAACLLDVARKYVDLGRKGISNFRWAPYTKGRCRCRGLAKVSATMSERGGTEAGVEPVPEYRGCCMAKCGDGVMAQQRWAGPAGCIPDQGSRPTMCMTSRGRVQGVLNVRLHGVSASTQLPN